MRNLSFAALLVFTFGVACAAPPTIEKRPDEHHISLIALIANPEKFDGKYVSVGGYLELSWEYENSLYLDENSSLSGMSGNSIAINFDESPSSVQTRAEELDQSYVYVAGFFKAGPTTFSLGELQSVYRILPAPKNQ